MPDFRHAYRSWTPFVRFTLLSAGSIAALIFVLLVFQKLISWEISYQRHKQVLSRPIPVGEEKNTVQVPAAQQGAEEKSSNSMGVFRAQDNRIKTWNWPDSQALNRKALQEFTRAKKWDPALHIGAKMSRDVLFQEELFRLVEGSYLTHMDKALRQERRILDALPGERNVFDRAAFLVNVRENLRSEVPVSSIREILFRSYLATVSDRFVRSLLLSESAGNRKERIAYGKEAGEFFSAVLRKDPGSLNWYLKTRWDELNAAANTNPVIAEILGPPTAQAQALSSPEKSGIMPEEYRELSKRKRMLLARFAAEELPPELQESVFSGGISNQELLQMLRDDRKTGGVLLSFLRSRPHYLEAVNRRDYDAALPKLRADAAALPGGVSAEAEHRIKSTLELEKKWMNEYFPIQKWEEALRKKTEARLSQKLSSRDFLDLLRTLLKQRAEIPEEKQKALLALCELNRGRSGGSLALFLQTTQENLIQNNIPPEELNND